ncbi:MAG: ATP-grasp domain-containing protein [Candidatus Bathyarchaeota archaeon]|nr:ATP-grasp domain-containing protein [Candidatus Bathyarchaeum sp.]
MGNGVLIAEGHNPVVLPILRSLGKRKVDTAIMSSYSLSVSRFSKYCKRQVLVPSTSFEKEYACAVEKIVKKTKFDLLFPIFEWSLLPISKNRDRISPYVNLPIARHDSILKCFDKRSTMKLATEHSVPIPQTFFVDNSTAKLNKISQEITYPCIVKPRWSMVWGNGRAYHRRGGLVNSPAELIATYNSIHQYFPYPLIQEYVPGTNFSVATVYNNGKPRAFCCIKVTRAWPPEGGNSCYRETVPLTNNLRKYSETLLKALDWHGIAELEFRVDSRDNIPKLLEINPRFWGSLSVAVKAGVDFPYLLYQIAMDGDVKGVFNYKVGVKGRYFDQDLLYLFSMLKNGFTNHIFKNQNNLKVLASWLKFYEPGLFYDLFELDDPLPFLFNSALFPVALAKIIKKKVYPWSRPGVSF